MKSNLRGGFMNKNKQELYLSGLISEEQLAETSDFEHSMSLAQKMRNDFEKIEDVLWQCLESCKSLKKQAEDNHAFHDNTGMGRIDSQGVGDVDYFEDVLEKISKLTRSIDEIVGNNGIVPHTELSIDALIKRLEQDF